MGRGAWGLSLPRRGGTHLLGVGLGLVVGLLLRLGGSLLVAELRAVPLLLLGFGSLGVMFFFHLSRQRRWHLRLYVVPLLGRDRHVTPERVADLLVGGNLKRDLVTLVEDGRIRTVLEQQLD